MAWHPSVSLSGYRCVLGSFRLQFYVGTRLQAWVFIIVTLCRQFAAGCVAAAALLPLCVCESELRKTNKAPHDDDDGDAGLLKGKF